MVQEVFELLWLKVILEDLNFQSDGPKRLYCNNKLAINITHNLV